MGIALSILIGLGLAAACGFRVFVPLLVLAIAAKTGWVGLTPSLSFLGSTEAIIALSFATVLEILAYKVPWMDHALDVVASPAAVIAGAIVAASQIGSISTGSGGGHMLVWACGLIVGAAAAGAVQATTVSLRAASTATTAGIANPALNRVQSLVSLVMSLVAVLTPWLVGVVFVGLVVLLIVGIKKLKAGKLKAAN